MEYTTLIEPLGIITISLLIGAFCGAYWMFLIMYKSEQNALKELDIKTKEVEQWKNQWENKYVDDDPCGRFNKITN
jgi:hypothetical protein